ncbi:MAG TPA: 3-oxoacyl-[acyl-carrier-protein] synthase III C-terminal domain-containing protein [Kofleriaceae bacterium]|jgi:3-oxoacyl-[acyl-carrier-protein] synthase-3
MTSIGILSVGTYIPPTVRTNEFWSRATVDEWTERMAARVTRGDALPTDISDGARLTIEAMTAYAKDPFRGARKRHTLGDMSIHEAETRAAREAIQRAGLRPDEIDVILTETMVPEQLLVNCAAVVHKALELPARCMAIMTSVACNGFAMHATMAKALIASGQARNVLSVVGCGTTRVVDSAEPDSAWWGDGAAAVVFGPVSEGRGILSAIHHTDGTASNALVIGIPGKHWWDQGQNTLHSADRSHTRTMLMGLADRARDAIHASISAAGLQPTDIDFYASHQGTVWLADVTKKHAGLDRAQTLSTFSAFGHLGSVNIPLILSIAEKEGMLRDGMLLTTFTGGVGETWSSMCFRWGR